jgi:ADP-heptose:LPS heptosyltransferase
VLTTPVLRCIRQQMPGTELHYVTKKAFSDVLRHNPNIDKLYTFDQDVAEVYESLAAEHYDCVIDLHKNLRSFRLKRKLGVKSYSFNKLNIEKFLAVRFKAIDRLPNIHIVERYLETLRPLGIVGDGKGLEYFLGPEDHVHVSDVFFAGQQTKFMALVVGGSYYTKQIPMNKLREICAYARLPMIILGGRGDAAIANELKKEFPGIVNACGQYSLNQSASVIQQAEWVITSDTGLMHIASAFNKKIISLWGNTIPEFGMSPYMPLPENKLLEVKGLSCRPCSKLGYKKCPEGHFKCMNAIDLSFLKEIKS